MYFWSSNLRRLFLIPSNFQHELSVLKFNSILTLETASDPTHGGLSPARLPSCTALRHTPSSDASHKPGLLPVLLAVDQSLQWPPSSGSINLQSSSQDSEKHLTHFHQFTIKGLDKGYSWTSGQTRCTGQGAGTKGRECGIKGQGVRERAWRSRAHRSPPPSQHLHALTNPEALWSPYFGDFYGCLPTSQGHEQSLTPPSALLPS